MIDALLYAVRDTIRSANIGYSKAECDITGESGEPPPRCGNVYVAIHGGKARSTADNQLNKLYDFSLTLTMRVTISLDRIGDQLIARNIELVPLGQRQGFNAKMEQLEALLHMNWAMTVLQNQTPPSANDNIVAWSSSTNRVYGFCEPARSRGTDNTPTLVGGEWFGSDPDAADVGLKAEMRFEGARRFQPQTQAIGPFI